MWTLFSSKIGKTVSENVPERRQQNGGRLAWLNREIKAAINRKRRLWKKAKGASGVEEYREADKKVKNMMGTAKRNFEKRLANEKGSSNGPFYAYVKKSSKIRSTIGPLKDKENRTITDDKEMAELLNKFFSSVFTREDVQNVPSAAEMEAPSLETMDITYRMVQEKIRSLKPASAPGPDGIGPQLLQELQKELVPALVLIFRRSIQNEEVPEDWKCANVTPIFKKGSKADLGITVLFRSPHSAPKSWSPSSEILSWSTCWRTTF
jgi:hypothetical protein